MKRVLLLLMLASLTACGVKNDLVKPNGQPTPSGERDPSRPPSTTTSGK
jgi:predicted small lipoprotein YifL